MRPMMRYALPLLVLLNSTALYAADATPLQVAELGDFQLASGAVIRDARIGYRTAGDLNADRSNAVLFPTWFTGTSEDLFTSDAVGAVDTSRFFLITVDALANGTSSSPSNSARQPKGEFPRLTIGDMVRSQHQLLTEVLGITHLHAVLGISMGGMQTYEWVTAYPDFMHRAVPIVGSPRLGSYDLLLWTAELSALEQAQRCDCDATAALELAGMISQLALQTPAFHTRQDPHDRGAALLQAGRAGGYDDGNQRPRRPTPGNGRARRLGAVRRCHRGRGGCRHGRDAHRRGHPRSHGDAGPSTRLRADDRLGGAGTGQRLRAPGSRL